LAKKTLQQGQTERKETGRKLQKRKGGYGNRIGEHCRPYLMQDEGTDNLKKKVRFTKGEGDRMSSVLLFSSKGVDGFGKTKKSKIWPKERPGDTSESCNLLR